MAPRSVAVFEDLGVQQAPNSALCAYLNKLLWILTGNFARPGGQHLHSWFGRCSAGTLPEPEIWAAANGVFDLPPAIDQNAPAFQSAIKRCIRNGMLLSLNQS